MTTKHTTSERPDLGKLVGDVLSEFDRMSAFMNDPITVASGCADELAPDLWRASVKRVGELLDEAGMTPREFVEEVERRTSPKWAYFSGVWVAVDELGDQAREETDDEYAQRLLREHGVDTSFGERA